MYGKNRKVSKARITNLANEKKLLTRNYEQTFPDVGLTFNKIRKSNKDFVFKKLSQKFVRKSWQQFWQNKIKKQGLRVQAVTKICWQISDNFSKKNLRKRLAEMCSKTRKFSKSNKFNKVTMILIASCIIRQVYPINATVTLIYCMSYICARF